MYKGCGLEVEGTPGGEHSQSGARMYTCCESPLRGVSNTQNPVQNIITPFPL